MISGLQPFRYVPASRSACHPGRSYRSDTSISGQPWRFHPSLSCLVTSACPGDACRPNGQLAAGDCHPVRLTVLSAAPPHRGLADFAEGSLGEPPQVQRRSEETLSATIKRARAPTGTARGNHGEDSQGVLLLSRFDAALDRPSRCRGPRFEAVNRHAAGSSTHERGLSRAPSSGGGGPASSVRRKALLMCAEVPPQLWQHCPRFLSPPLRGHACRISRRARSGGPGKEYCQNGVLN